VTRAAVLAVAAERDIDEAKRWYESHGGPDLAARFVRAIATSLRRIERFPEAHPVVHRHRRRALVRPFPYMLLYSNEPDQIFVYRCLHLHRDPDLWNRRARGRRRER
jgi:plasmid stabilization system protein ParE